MISRQFFKSSVIYATVGALPYASGFLLIPWFTAYLTPAQFGINALYISMMYLIQIFASYGQDMSISVQYFDYKDNAQKLKEYLGTVFIGLGIMGATTFLFFFFGGISLFNLVFKSADFIDVIPFGLFTILTAIMNSSVKTYSTLLITQQRPERFFWINIITFLLTIGCSLTLLYLFPFTLYGPILGRMIPAIISASIALALMGKQYGLAWNPGLVRKIVRYSSPLMAYALLTWVVTYIDRFLILRFLRDPALVGIFDFAVKLVIGLDLVMTGLVNTVNPKIYNIWKDQGLRESNTEINRYYNGLTAFFLLVIPLFVLLAPLLIPLVVHKAIYYQAFAFIAILASGYATRVWFYMFLAPLMFFKRTAALPGIFVVSAVFEIVVAIILINYFGLIGAVWTNFMVKPVQALLMYLECRKVYTFKVNAWKIFYTPVIFIMIVLVSETLSPPALKLYVESGQFLIAVILVYFAYRKELIPLLIRFFPWLSLSKH